MPGESPLSSYVAAVPGRAKLAVLTSNVAAVLRSRTYDAASAVPPQDRCTHDACGVAAKRDGAFGGGVGPAMNLFSRLAVIRWIRGSALVWTSLYSAQDQSIVTASNTPA